MENCVSCPTKALVQGRGNVSSVMVMVGRSHLRRPVPVHHPRSCGSACMWICQHLLCQSCVSRPLLPSTPACRALSMTAAAVPCLPGCWLLPDQATALGWALRLLAVRAT
eukprot:357713-Chlamydomonas_euryale.AAC.27